MHMHSIIVTRAQSVRMCLWLDLHSICRWYVELFRGIPSLSPTQQEQTQLTNLNVHTMLVEYWCAHSNHHSNTQNTHTIHYNTLPDNVTQASNETLHYNALHDITLLLLSFALFYSTWLYTTPHMTLYFNVQCMHWW